ncbi:hypothetical protein J2851_000474 [Azospirillum rugosum]|uniref:Uncharacterized protein n=1 Tax=Azospirillum rugosum TaxID=416170 RepID=A0ABS4SFL3_9PROT|nr:hypothetical protein [Azospirillum rugosum]MDQ0525626.1 hypothetical protein [Azospirillum rugosum]
MACSLCKHFARWAPTAAMRHPQYGDCTDPEQWGEGGTRLVRDCETCDRFVRAESDNAAA